MTDAEIASQVALATQAGLLAVTRLVDANVGSDAPPAALRSAFDKTLRERGAAELAPRFGLSTSEFRDDFVAVFRGAAGVLDPASGLSAADARIAQLRFLGRIDTVNDRGTALDVPPLPVQSSELMAQKQVRAVELVLRALINEKSGGQVDLANHLRRLFGTKLVEKWLQQAGKGDVLTGTLFSEIAQIFTHDAEFPKYAPIYTGDAVLTFLQDKRETIRMFLEDIRFVRNRVYHHKALTPSQIDLLECYYEQILLPVQALYDRKGTQVNPDSYFDVDRGALGKYFQKIEEDLTSIYDKIAEVGEHVVQIKTETEGLKERTQQTHGMVSLLRSRVGMVLGGIVLLLVLAGATVAIVNGGKKETSVNPREELANLGVAWSIDSLQQAILNDDTKTVKLFFEGGMSPDLIWNRTSSFITVFAYGSGDPSLSADFRNFHEDIAELIEQYPQLINPPQDCPDDLQYSANGDEVSYYYLVGERNPHIISFLRFFCNKPEVFSKIDARITALRSQGRNSDVANWEKSEAILKGDSN